MGDIRLDDAGVAWQHCPACGQEVVPSYNGWARHELYCPTVRAAKRSASDFERTVESVKADTTVSEAEAQALAAELREVGR